jgi:glutaredoxin
MSFLINIVRNLLGSFIALIDLITRPQKRKRSVEAQNKVEQELKNITLYQFFACPFCIKTRRALHRLNLPMQTRNATKGSPYLIELEQQGGKIQVPCLRISEEGQVKWLYESSEIISYLEQRFA